MDEEEVKGMSNVMKDAFDDFEKYWEKTKTILFNM